ncbi:MAG: Spy/CpxP family protein refolding chaperone [bacterium]
MAKKTSLLLLALGALLVVLVVFQPAPLAAPAPSPMLSQEIPEEMSGFPNLFDGVPFEAPEDVAAGGEAPFPGGRRNPMMQGRMQAGRPGEGPCPGMMRMGPNLKEKLNLTPQQEEEFNRIFLDGRKDMIRKQAEIKIAGLELAEILRGSNPDFKQIEVKVRQVEKMQADMKLAGIKSLLDAKKLLTPEQVKKLEELRGMKGRAGGPPQKS